MCSHAFNRATYLSLACFLVLYCSSVLAENKAATSQDVNYSMPFSLAISGGISLGSYEAGLNWALLKYMKTRRNEITASEPDTLFPELMSSVGASAGSINALISALTWCVDDSKVQKIRQTQSGRASFTYSDSINENLFRTLWLNIGIDEMLPAMESTYRAGDGILTRVAFDKAIHQITETLKADIFRADCSLPLGMTVTRVEPTKMSIAGVEVENQRFMIPVRLQARLDDKHSGRIEIVSHLVNKDDPFLGNVMYLRQTKLVGRQHYVIEPEHLIDAILASSAYPFAFGQVELPHCAAQSGNDKTAKPHECPAGYNSRRDEFIDGGVFDNVPLGIAKALAEPRKYDLNTRERWQHTARPFNYIYLDPDNRRPVMQAEPAVNQEQKIQEDDDSSNGLVSSGIRGHLKFLGGAIATGRHYELYNVLRGGGWTSHSYDFACRLSDAITKDSNSRGGCSSKLNPNINTCERLLKGKLDVQHKLKRKERETAAACLLQDAAKLELVYKGNEGVGSSAESITHSRRQLLKQMQALAEQSGLHQLALYIEASKEDKLGDRRILLTRRFAPITGDMLGAFGAFIDRPFREYDYYAGIYDAVYGLADFFCTRRTDYQLCLANESKRIYLKLAIAASADANSVFYLLATHEHPDYQQQASPWQWLASPTYFTQQQVQGNFPIIFAALTRDFDPAQDTVYEEPEFTDFIKTLFNMGYDISNSSQFIQRIHRLQDKDPKTWYYPLTSRISARMLEMEKESTDNYAPLVRGAMGLGAFALHSYIEDKESKLLIRSAAPADSWMNWLPYEIGADYRNGGLVVSWLPGVDLSENVSLDFKVTPAHLNRFAGDTIWFSQADLYLSYQRKGIFSSFGVGPTYTYSWKEWPGAKQSNVGASVYVGILHDKLRFSFGQRSFDDNGFAGDSTYLYISITDIPGLVYWLTKGN